MQKIKINNKLITILFIVYLIISFFINSVKMIYDYFDEVEIGTDFNKESFIALYEKELQDMTEEDKEELEITFDLDKIHLFDEINKELIF